VARAVLVERQRLLAPAARAALVVVGAPSGYGKSVFAEQVLRRWGLATLRWRPSSLTEYPVDAAALVDGLRRSASRAGLVDLGSAMLATSPQAAVEACIDQLAATRSELAVLLDDVHRLDDDAAELVARLVEGLPPACRLVLCHRPDRRFDHLASQMDATTVDDRDLSMRPDEVAAVVRRVVGTDPSQTLIDDLLRATVGWPVAVNLASIRLRDDGSWHPGFPSSGAKLLAGLVTPILGDDLAAAALVSVPPLLDRTIVDLLAGDGAWQRWQTHGPPMVASAGWYVVPDAVREAVLAVAGGRPSLSDHDLRSVAERYVAHGEVAAAVELCQIVGRADLLVEVLGACHWSVLEAAGAAGMVTWFDLADSASPAVLARFGLALVRALEADRPDLRDRMVERLVQLARHGELPGPTIREIQAEDIRRRTAPDTTRAIVRDAEAALDATPLDELRTRARLHQAAGIPASMLSLPEDKERAVRHLRAAAELYGLLRETRWQAAALARLGYNVLFHAGRFVEADTTMREALALLPAGDRTRGFWLSCHAEVQDHLGARVEAIATAREALAIGERLRDRNVQATAWWTLAWIHGHRGDLAALHESMAAVEAIGPAFLDTYSGIDFYGSMVDHLVACGDVEGARRCLERVRSHPVSAAYQPGVRMAEARWEAVVGDPARAIAILGELGGDVGTQRNADWVRLVESAIAHARSGDLAVATEITAAAFAECAALGVPDLPVRLERSLVQRLDDLLGGIVPTLLAARSDDGGGASERLEDRPADIVVLGEFAIRRGAVDVTPPDGLAATLVKVVAVRGPTHVESLIDEFWPDVDVDTGRARLRNLLHRVRSRCGDVVDRRGELLVLASGVHTDLQAFERAVADLQGADDLRRPALARRALSLYGGDLLPGDAYADWITVAREHLRRRHLEILDVIADAAERAGASDEAMELRRRTVDLDPLDDARCVRAAQLHLQHGRAGIARALAGRTVLALRDLGLPVSDELTRLSDGAAHG
jgi:DNA-binding SARP family transcriptional activator